MILLSSYYLRSFSTNHRPTTTSEPPPLLGEKPFERIGQKCVRSSPFIAELYTQKFASLLAHLWAKVISLGLTTFLIITKKASKKTCKTMNKDRSGTSDSCLRRPEVGGPSCSTAGSALSLMETQKKAALLNRIYAEVRSSTDRRLLVLPQHAGGGGGSASCSSASPSINKSSWMTHRPEQVLEILDGALCIHVEDCYYHGEPNR